MKNYVYALLMFVLISFFSNTFAQELRLLEENHYKWNGIEWIYDTRYLYEYLESGKIDKMNRMIFTNGSLSNTLEYDCSYLASDLYQLHCYFSHESDPETVPYYSYSYDEKLNYNLQGVLLYWYKHIESVSDTDSYSSTLEKICYYTDNRLDSVYFENYYYDECYKLYYIYDEFDRLANSAKLDLIGNEIVEQTDWKYITQSQKEAVTQSKESGSWENKNKRILLSDPNNDIRKEERYNWLGSEWSQYEVDSLYYYDGNISKKVITFEYEPDTKIYTNSKKIEYIYNDPTLSIDNVLLDNFELYRNYPNPFNPTTLIKFALKKTSDIKLFVYNIYGQKIAELINGIKQAGIHSVDFDGSRLNSGVYYYTLKVAGKSLTQKMILMK